MPHAHPSGVPPRALECASDGEGQALALREGGGVFFIVARGPVPRVGQRQLMFLGPLGPTCL